jgi:hypothetical protein
LGAEVEAGNLRAATVQFLNFTARFHQAGADYRTFQLLFPYLIGHPVYASPARFAAVFDPDAPLGARVCEDLHAYYGFTAVVPSELDPSSEEARELMSWPPAGHWSDYLSAALVAACGGPEVARTALAPFPLTVLPGGAMSVSLGIPPEDVCEPNERQRRRLLTEALRRLIH